MIEIQGLGCQSPGAHLAAPREAASSTDAQELVHQLIGSV